jgi:Ca2+-binding RTX toxin-like protein
MIEPLETRRLLSVSHAPLGEPHDQLVNPLSITGRGTLMVQGTTGNDIINISSDDAGVVHVSMIHSGDIAVSQSFEGVNRVIVEGAAGNDRITFISSKNIPVTLLGGAGDDRIEARGRKVTLSGGAGNDDLIGRGLLPMLFYGGTGNDRIMGTRGVDTIYGGAGEDRADRSAGADELHSIEIREILDL